MPSSYHEISEDKRTHVVRWVTAMTLFAVCLSGVGTYTYFVLKYSFRITGDPGRGGGIGSVGPTGATGGVGQTGVIGVNGTTGKTGPTGQQGLIGGQGPRGWNCWETNQTRMNGTVAMCVGPNGTVGIIGPTGGTGIVGPTGSAGGLHAWDRLFTNNCTGINDWNGDGVCNITDANGVPCDPSYNTTKCPGLQGYQGQRGNQGITGPTGADNFTAGPTGATGCPCWDLACSGTLSLQDIIAYNINGDGTLDALDCKGGIGLTGDTGSQGLQGFSAIDGTNGANGTNGINGTNGTNGTNGVVGATGATGATGGYGDNGTVLSGADVLPGEPVVTLVTMNTSVRIQSSTPIFTFIPNQRYSYQTFGANQEMYRLSFNMDIAVYVPWIGFCCLSGTSTTCSGGTLYGGVPPTGVKCNLVLNGLWINTADFVTPTTPGTVYANWVSAFNISSTASLTMNAVWDCQLYASSATGPSYRFQYGFTFWTTNQVPCKVQLIDLVSTARVPSTAFTQFVNDGAVTAKFECTITSPRLGNY